MILRGGVVRKSAASAHQQHQQNQQNQQNQHNQQSQRCYLHLWCRFIYLNICLHFNIFTQICFFLHFSYIFSFAYICEHLFTFVLMCRRRRSLVQARWPETWRPQESWEIYTHNFIIKHGNQGDFDTHDIILISN